MTAPPIQAAGSDPAAAPSTRAEITYFYGIRGLSSVYILYFHLNNIILIASHGVEPRLYARLTDWLRVGDFRVSAFFVISGYLLTLPTLRTADWKLSDGMTGFLSRRVERLLFPYYVALVLSVVLFVAWKGVTGVPLNVGGLILGIVAHVLLVHNLDPRTNLYINDTLWNVALEFQCYLLFAFVLLPVMRRLGPWAQLGTAAVIGLGPHFLMHGWLDWTRPWFITLYAMGVFCAALGNRAYPDLIELRRRTPWGAIWLMTSVASTIAIVTSGVDTSYGNGWLQNILFGIAISSFLVYVSTGCAGPLGGPAHRLVQLLQNAQLCALGRFSYSTYLIQFPIMRLAIALTVAATNSFWVMAALGFFVYAPLVFVLAYGFHVCFERPFQKRRMPLGSAVRAGA